MSKYYYIDSENIGEAWIKLLADSDEDAYFFIFYTSKSQHISYPNLIRLMSFKNKIEFILCHEGNNALDFQLVSYLGYQLITDLSQEIFIVSKDTGFDAVVSFWQERMVSIKRIDLSATSIIKQELALVSNINNTLINTTTPQKEQIDIIPDNIKIKGQSKKIIDELISACPSDNTSYLHLFLTHFFGRDNGLDIYKEVTSNSYKAVAHNWDSKTRFSILCKYIGEFATDNIKIDDRLINLLYSHRKSPANALALFSNLYSGNEQIAYRRAFKPFVKSLAKL